MSKSRVSDGRSIDLIRKLLERNLVDRAVLLGEGRWPGSGPFIHLAAEWQHLTPDERATRLRDIGPEGLERARALSDVHPEIGRVLDTLEAQGILTQHDGSLETEPVTVQPRTVEQTAPPAPAPEEQNVALDLEHEAAEESSDAPAELESVTLPVVVEPAVVQGLPDMPATPATLDREAILRPVVDEQAVAAAEAILDRVHQRLQTSIERPDVIPMPSPASEHVAPTPEPQQREELPKVGLTDGVAHKKVLSIRRATAAQRLGYTEIDISTHSRRDLFGALERTAHGVETVVGALPKAVSRPGVVVVIGNVLPRMIERLRAGYCDIPGTRSTVRVHPESRIVLVNNSQA